MNWRIVYTSNTSTTEISVACALIKLSVAHYRDRNYERQRKLDNYQRCNVLKPNFANFVKEEEEKHTH